MRSQRNSFLSLMERHVSIVFLELVERMTEELTASAPFTLNVKVVLSGFHDVLDNFLFTVFAWAH